MSDRNCTTCANFYNETYEDCSSCDDNKSNHVEMGSTEDFNTLNYILDNIGEETGR